MLNATIGTMGAEKIAAHLGISPSCVYRFGQDPDKSGKDIPVRHLLKLIALAASEETNQALQKILDELLAHFAAPARRKIVRLSALMELEEVLLQLKNGKSYDSVIQRCDQCGGPLKIKGKIDGLFLYECPRCHGVGQLEAK